MFADAEALLGLQGAFGGGAGALGALQECMGSGLDEMLTLTVR